MSFSTFRTISADCVQLNILLEFPLTKGLAYKFSIEVGHRFMSNHSISLLKFSNIYAQMQVELEATGEKQETEEAPDTEPDSQRAPETPDFPSAEDEGAESPLEVHSDQAHPGSTTAGFQQHEERRELEEETHVKPAGESHPSVPADGKGTDSPQDSFKHQDTLESQESPHTDMSKQPEHKEPAVDGEIQVMAGSGEAAEEITQPEDPELGKSPPNQVPSQEQEDPDIKQEHID